MLLTLIVPSVLRARDCRRRHLLGREERRDRTAARLQWLRIIRAGARERAGSRAITAEAGVIGVVGVDIGRI